LVRLSRGTLAPSIHPAGEAVPFRRIVYWRAEMMEHHHPGKWDQYKQNNDHGEQDKPTASGCPIRSHNHVNPPLHQSNKQRGAARGWRHLVEETYPSDWGIGSTTATSTSSRLNRQTAPHLLGHRSLYEAFSLSRQRSLSLQGAPPVKVVLVV